MNTTKLSLTEQSRKERQEELLTQSYYEQERANALAEWAEQKLEEPVDEITQTAPKVVVMLDGLHFIVRDDYGEKNLYLSRHCDRCGWVEAGHVYNRAVLGELLETSDQDWLNTHIETHKPGKRQMLDEVLGALAENLDTAYDALISATREFYITQDNAADHEKDIQEFYFSDLAAGYLDGKNDDQRKAAHQALHPVMYTSARNAKNFANQKKLEHELALLQVYHLRAHLRIIELGTQYGDILKP